MPFSLELEKNLLTIERTLSADEMKEVSAYLISRTDINSLIIHSANDGLLQALNNQVNIYQNLTSLDLSWCSFITDEGLASLKDASNLTSLNLSGCLGIPDEGLASLKGLSNLTSLNLSHCFDITDKGLASLKGLSNLTSLNLSHCFDITDKGLASLKGLSNLTSLDLSHCFDITDEGLASLNNLSHLTSLDLSRCNKITDKGLASLKDASNLTSLTLLLCRNITVKGIELFIENNPAFTTFDMEYNDFSKELMKIREAKSRPNFNMEEATKEMIFRIAPYDNGEIITHILDNSQKYPFLINSKDTAGHDLMHFYNHSPQMQQFLFTKGMIPAKEVDDVMQNIVRDSQSVHMSEITKRINFFTKELTQEFGDDFTKLAKEAEECKSALPRLFAKDSKLAIQLLDLAAQEKQSVMEETLGKDDALPSDEDFVSIVTAKAAGILEANYLRKNIYGAYDQGYPSALMQYDWTVGAEKQITIPASIGLIYSLATKLEPTVEAMIELTVTLFNKNPKLIQSHLMTIEALGADIDVKGFTGREDRQELHKLLAPLSEDTIQELFQTLSGLDIKEVYHEQQLFKLAKQLYVAATTYDKDSSSCTQGTWAQIITTAEELDSSLNDKWAAYREGTRAQEALKNGITGDDIKLFVKSYIKNELLSKDSIALGNPDLYEALLDLATAMIDINTPEKITPGQQELLSCINTYCSSHIKELLPHSTLNMPTHEQYYDIICAFSEAPEMQDFAQNPDVYVIGEDYHMG